MSIRDTLPSVNDAMMFTFAEDVCVGNRLFRAIVKDHANEVSTFDPAISGRQIDLVMRVVDVQKADVIPRSTPIEVRGKQYRVRSPVEPDSAGLAVLHLYSP